MQEILSFALGYLVSAGLGYMIIRRVIDKLSEESGVKRPYKHLSARLGVYERILYTSALLAGFGQFIVFWLLAKVGAGWIWQIWQRSSKEAQPPGARYNIFLIGNALSIAFGAFGALIIWILVGYFMGVSDFSTLLKRMITGKPLI